MLTGTQVRVRFAKQRVIPVYLPTDDRAWLGVAERLLEQFRGREGTTRSTLEEETDAIFGGAQNQPVYQGLARLLEDRCEFEVQAVGAPDELRRLTFEAAARHRQNITEPFARLKVLEEVGLALRQSAEAIDRSLFADLKSEQKLVSFQDISAARLLERYNVALAQAVLLRSTRVQVKLTGLTPSRCRQICRRIKFHRLVCDIETRGGSDLTIRLDGPLSLFSATQKYGLQLALFLPAILACPSFELTSDVRWGAQRKEKTFLLTQDDGLVASGPDPGQYVPPEMAMFVELFRKKITDWDLAEEGEMFRLGNHFWVPDYRLTERASGRIVYLEVLGFWRRSSLEVYLERLRRDAKMPFVLAVSDQLHVEEAALDGLPVWIHRFRNMPLPDEIVRLAGEVLKAIPAKTTGAAPDVA
jgi:predicted nuclease of restriction endonuclease-like RecB superfamily